MAGASDRVTPVSHGTKKNSLHLIVIIWNRYIKGHPTHYKGFHKNRIADLCMYDTTRKSKENHQNWTILLSITTHSWSWEVLLHTHDHERLYRSFKPQKWYKVGASLQVCLPGHDTRLVYDCAIQLGKARKAIKSNLYNVRCYYTLMRLSPLNHKRDTK